MDRSRPLIFYVGQLLLCASVSLLMRRFESNLESVSCLSYDIKQSCLLRLVAAIRVEVIS
jgi:hypothetical protein